MPEAHNEEQRPGDAADDGNAGAGETEQQAEQAAQSSGGDPDAGPSVTPEEIERGLARDQAEG